MGRGYAPRGYGRDVNESDCGGDGGEGPGAVGEGEGEGRDSEVTLAVSQVDGRVGWFSTLTATHPRARTHVGLSFRLLGLSCERCEVFDARGSDFCDCLARQTNGKGE